MTLGWVRTTPLAVQAVVAVAIPILIKRGIRMGSIIVWAERPTIITLVVPVPCSIKARLAVAVAVVRAPQEAPPPPPIVTWEAMVVTECTSLTLANISAEEAEAEEVMLAATAVTVASAEGV
jgi:hypothetical protein